MHLKPKRFAALGLVAMGAVACSAEDGPDGPLSLSTSVAEFASDFCPEGGHRIETGLDNNGNGKLDDYEVTSASSVCDGAKGKAGDPTGATPGKRGGSGTPAGVHVSEIGPGVACANGGQRVDLGLDADADGEIDPGSDFDTVYVCNGETGATGEDGGIVVVNTTAEPSGANCANGGQRLDYGFDDDRDGTLEASEIDSTRYACNRAPGASGAPSLFKSSAEAAGAICPSGGQRIDNGLDTNGNGTLDPAEVTGTSYTCNGGDGNPANVKLAIVDVVAEAPGANCAAGGQMLTYGVDDDGDETLGAFEIDATRYVCSGGNGGNALAVLVNVAVEPISGNCTGGGQKVTIGLDDNDNQTLEPGEVDQTSYVCNFDEFQNPSFELPAYQGWTVGSTSQGQWTLATTGTTLNRLDTVFDYADNRNEQLTSPGLPYTVTATEGTTIAFQAQNGPGIHRIYQDFSVPLGTTTLTWDMYYKNNYSTFVPNPATPNQAQYIAINVRDPKDDSVIATLYKTQPTDPLVLPATMQQFSANLSAYAGHDIRFDIETNIQRSWIDVALDNFKLQ